MEVYDANTDKRVMALPWTSFPHKGDYEIVLSIANNAYSNNFGIDSPRDVLYSTLNCDCERAVFSVSIARGFGNIFYSALSAALIVAIGMVGIIRIQAYIARKKNGFYLSPSFVISERKELFQYFVMLSAIAAGAVHLSIYADHSSLNVDYIYFC